MSRIGGAGGGPRSGKVVLAVDAGGGGARAVVLRAGGGFELLEAWDGSPSDASAIAGLIKKHKPDMVVGVAPAAMTVAKAVSVPSAGPNAGPEELAAALDLLAEAELPASVPPHRRVAALIRDVDRPGTESAVVAGWMDRDWDAAPVLREVTAYVPLPMALAALRDPTDEVAGWHDEVSGVAAAIASGGDRTVCRVARCARDGFAGFVGETAASAGLPRDAVSVDGGVALGEVTRQGLRGRVRGLPGETGWLGRFGVLLGAALCAAAGDPLEARGAGLLLTPPRVVEPIERRVYRWLSVPRNAAAVIAAAVVVAVGAPLLASYARWQMLESKVPEGAGGSVDRAELRRRAELYDQLKRTRWPMTKLLSDVSTATPVGVVATNIRIAPDVGLSLQGTAADADALSTLQQNLASIGPFVQVQISRQEAGADGKLSFDISAQVAAPMKTVAVPEDRDFAATPLAVRLHGEGASNLTPPEGSRASGSRARTSGAPAAGDRGGSSSARIPTEMPKSLSDEDIAKMSRGEATREWAARRTFLQTNRGIDAKERDRLQLEIDKVQKRMREAPQ